MDIPSSLRNLSRHTAPDTTKEVYLSTPCLLPDKLLTSPNDNRVVFLSFNLDEATPRFTHVTVCLFVSPNCHWNLSGGFRTTNYSAILHPKLHGSQVSTVTSTFQLVRFQRAYSWHAIVPITPFPIVVKL